jgi:hypothetical protein
MAHGAPRGCVDTAAGLLAALSGNNEWALRPRGCAGNLNLGARETAPPHREYGGAVHPPGMANGGPRDEMQLKAQLQPKNPRPTLQRSNVNQHFVGRLGLGRRPRAVRRDIAPNGALAEFEPDPDRAGWTSGSSPRFYRSNTRTRQSRKSGFDNSALPRLPATE